MLHLLNLPLEIRELILEYALPAPRSPPLNPWTGAETRKPILDIEYEAWGFGPKHTLYESDPDQQQDNNCSLLIACRTTQSLVSVNRQIREETKAILNRMMDGKLRYKLDVMVVNEMEIWPTWLSVPVFATHLDEVHVTLRIFGHCISAEGLRKSARNGDAGFLWCFYALLERFLVHGPVGMKRNHQDETTNQNQQKKKKHERKFYIKTLVLDIKSCAEEEYPFPPPEITWDDYRKYRRPRGRKFTYEPDLSEFALRPEWLAQMLYPHIFWLLRLRYHTLYYGGILYEHIGKIRLLVEGKLKGEYDLAELLAPMKFDCGTSTSSRETRREYFWRLKKRALEKRMKEGLTVIWPPDPELEAYVNGQY